MPSFTRKSSLGWLPEFPNAKDYKIGEDRLSSQAEKAGEGRSLLTMLEALNVKVDELDTLKLPRCIDLRPWCSPVEDQGRLNSCTANAGVSLVEYCQNKASGQYTDGSRLFLYKATRNLMRMKGDSGAFNRTTMEAIRLFGVVPESYWPYSDERAGLTPPFDQEPSPFCYQIADDYKALTYFRLDTRRLDTDELLLRIKTVLASGLACIFGFTVFDSIVEADGNGGFIPVPDDDETPAGGHSIMAVGYDDDACDFPSIGSIRVKNSWGTGWANGGYGWLPYDYVTKDLTGDWWCIIKGNWVDQSAFGLLPE